jgi:hypothetical protein
MRVFPNASSNTSPCVLIEQYSAICHSALQLSYVRRSNLIVANSVTTWCQLVPGPGIAATASFCGDVHIWTWKAHTWPCWTVHTWPWTVHTWPWTARAFKSSHDEGRRLQKNSLTACTLFRPRNKFIGKFWFLILVILFIYWLQKQGLFITSLNANLLFDSSHVTSLPFFHLFFTPIFNCKKERV